MADVCEFGMHVEAHGFEGVVRIAFVEGFRHSSAVFFLEGGQLRGAKVSGHLVRSASSRRL